MKEFRCGEIVPVCDARFQVETEDGEGGGEEAAGSFRV